MRLAAFLLLLTWSVVAATPYFRSDKMNYIYQKALQHIDDKKRLGRLEDELKTFDNVYMDVKQKDMEGSDVVKDDVRVTDNTVIGSFHDEETLAETGVTYKPLTNYAGIDEKLRKMLARYNLEQTIDSFKMKKKMSNEHGAEADTLVLDNEKFEDQRLQKLWLAALNAKFGNEALKALYGDLKQAERKVHEYHDALQAFNKVPDENSVHFEEHENLDEKNRRLKDAHKAMYEHIDELHKKVTDDAYLPFDDPKVKKLWATAQANANLTAHDLEIIREELHHFDKQLKKLEFHKQEVEAVKQSAQAAGKASIQKLEHGELEAKHERMSRKLKKLEHYIEEKIRHTEL